jgi:hypothetical protein
MKTTIKENVKQLLIEEPKLRDNDNALCFYYYNKICKISYNVALIDFYLDRDVYKLPSEQTITRLSRQLQEQNPELRGKEWEKRQRKVKKVQKELGYNVGN